MKKENYLWSAVVVLLCTALLTAQDITFSKNGRSTDKIIEHFEVENADVRSVLRQLSEFSGVDIVAGENVKGSVTLCVSNKSWREILNIVCKIENFTIANEGNYYCVLPNQGAQMNNSQGSIVNQISEETSPLVREIIFIKHTPALELKTSLEGLLSQKGKITVVEHNNALIVYDTEENIRQIKKMVNDLDIETAQIAISCKIIEVSSVVIQNMGVSWEYFSPGQNISASHIPQKTNFTTGALERLTYGIISPDKLSAALEYLFSDNRGEIVAQPQITTIDNKEARIFMGQQIPVKYLDEAGNTVIKMIDAGTEMVVTPHISGEGRIMLALSPKKESVTMQDGLPVINEQSASTNIVVNNGETVVIAGLTSNETNKTETGIPVLKNIPIIGNLFKKSDKNIDKKDLIIFVTPHIIVDKIGVINSQKENREKSQSDQK